MSQLKTVFRYSVVLVEPRRFNIDFVNIDSLMFGADLNFPRK